MLAFQIAAMGPWPELLDKNISRANSGHARRIVQMLLQRLTNDGRLSDNLGKAWEQLRGKYGARVMALIGEQTHRDTAILGLNCESVFK